MLETAAALVRLGLYAGITLAAGLALAGASLRAPPDARLRKVAAGAALAGAACAAGTFLLLLLRLGALGDASIALAILQTPSGGAFLLQLAGAAGLALTSLRHPVPAVAASIAALASFAVSGHAAAASMTASLLVLVHVLIASWWIGALLHLKQACRKSPPPAVAEELRRFTTQATVLVIVLMLAGAATLAAIVDFDPARLVSAYGAAFAAKIALFGVVMLLVAANRFRHAPRISQGDAAAVVTLRRSINLELLMIFAVLAATAILTTWTSPHG